MPKKTLSVVVPALNEESCIRGAVESVENAAAVYFEDWEIIIVNDGSRDQTGTIADEIARSNKRIQVIHHRAPKNLGACYKEALQRAKMEYYILVPGDNEYGQSFLEFLFSKVGNEDLIIPYTTNPEVRPLARQLISKGFVNLMNHLSGLQLHYYNGIVICRTRLIQSVKIRTDSFAYMAEALVRLLNLGATYTEVPLEIQYRRKGGSKAFRFKNLVDVGHFLIYLWFDINFGKTSKLARNPQVSSRGEN